MSSFGTYLQDLLEKRGISPYALGQAEDVHLAPATIYRWCSGSEVPSLQRSKDIAKIVAHLGLDDEEKRLLEEAQIASLKEWATTRAATRKPRVKGAGKEGIRIAHVLDMLQKLRDKPGQTPGTIYLTMNGETIFRADGDDRLHQKWHSIRLDLLRQGWSIKEFYRFGGETRRTEKPLDWINDVMDALQAGEGKFEPRYFKDSKGLHQPPYEILSIPSARIGLLFFATQQIEHVDRAVEASTPAFLEVLARHVALLESQTESLLETYSARQDFMWAIEKREVLAGDRLLVKPDFAGITRPMHFYDTGPWAEAARKDGWKQDEGRNELRDYYQKLLESFRKKMEDPATGYVYRDIISRRFIEDSLVALGQYSGYQSGGLGILIKQPELIKEHLIHIIEMLNAYDRYQIVYLDRAEEEKFPLAPFCEIMGPKEAQHVFLERRDEKGEIALEISEQRIAQAFRARFERFWDNLPAARKEKSQVIHWLDSLITKVDERISR